MVTCDTTIQSNITSCTHHVSISAILSNYSLIRKWTGSRIMTTPTHSPSYIAFREVLTSKFLRGNKHKNTVYWVPVLTGLTWIWLKQFLYFDNQFINQFCHTINFLLRNNENKSMHHCNTEIVLKHFVPFYFFVILAKDNNVSTYKSIKFSLSSKTCIRKTSLLISTTSRVVTLV